VAQGVPGRLRLRIFSTFGTTRVIGRQPKAPAAFTPGEIPGTYFQRLSWPHSTWFCRKEPRKKFQVTPPGINPETVRKVAQMNVSTGVKSRYSTNDLHSWKTVWIINIRAYHIVLLPVMFLARNSCPWKIWYKVYKNIATPTDKENSHRLDNST
jgi:hypothetical protein